MSAYDGKSGELEGQLDRNVRHTLQNQVTRLLEQRIQTEDFRPGQKVPSVREISSEYGVSRETAKIALNNLKRKGLVEILPSRGAYISEKGREPANQKKTGFIAFVVDMGTLPVASNSIVPLYEGMLAFLDNHVLQGEHHLASSYIAYHTDHGRSRFENLIEKVEGILVANLISKTLLERLLSTSVPVVSILSTIDIERLDDFNINSVKTYGKALRYLIDSGHRRIAYLDGGREYSQKTDRLAGCRAVAEQFAGRGLRCCEIYSEGWSSDDAYRAIRKWLRTGGSLDAILAVNDVLAVGALKACQEAGLDVPGDISVMGGRNTVLGRTSHPELTTIDYHYPELARSALNRLMERIQGQALIPVRTELIGSIIEKESCRRRSVEPDSKR